MKILHKSYGLNMPELLISIALLSTVVIIIIGLFMAGMSGLKKGDNLIIATNVGQTALEYYSQSILFNFNNPDYASMSVPLKLEDESRENLKFQKYLFIKDTGSTAIATNLIKEVTITIYWNEKGVETSTERRLDFKTIVNNYLD